MKKEKSRIVGKQYGQFKRQKADELGKIMPIIAAKLKKENLKVMVVC